MMCHQNSVRRKKEGKRKGAVRGLWDKVVGKVEKVAWRKEERVERVCCNGFD